MEGQQLVSIKKTKIALLIFIALIFHNFYRLSSLYFLIPLLLYGIYFFDFFKKPLVVNRKNKIIILYLIFIVFSVYIIFISFINSDFKNVAIGMSRFFYVIPISMIFYDTVKTEKFVSKLLFIYVFCSAIACATVPLQAFITGPINWFSPYSFRAGIIRYSSLLGNVSAMGIAGGLSFLVAILLPYRSKVLKFTICSVILISLFMSLQRAAVVNIILSFVFYFLFNDIKLKSKLFGLVFSLFIISGSVLLLLKFENTKVLTSFFLGSLGIAGAENQIVDYDPITSQIQYRVIGNTLSHFDYLKLTGFVFGIGYKGLGGVLAQPSIYAHNDFVNLFAVGGIGYFIFFIVFFYYIVTTLYRYLILSKKLENKDIYKNLTIFFAFSILFIINFVGGSGNYLQPNISILFWLIVGILGGHYFRFFNNLKRYKGKNFS